MDEDGTKATAALGALLSQTILEALVQAGTLSLADAVNVCVQVRDTASSVAGDPSFAQAAQMARLLETTFRKRLAEADGLKTN